MRALNRLRLGAALWLLATTAALPQAISGGGAGSAPVIIAQKYANNALTGTTSETNQAAIRVPANSVGANGMIRVTANWTYPSNANNKIMTVRFTNASGSLSGGQAFSTTQTTTVAFQAGALIRATGVTNAQTTFAAQSAYGSSAATANLATTTDTTQDSWVNLNGTLGVGTDTLTLVGYTVEVLYAQ